MSNLPLAASAQSGWIDDFGIVLVAAGIAVAVFYPLRLPIIFGYIIAGLLIGPNLFTHPLVKDPVAIQQISELGIIFLLFFIGMEFDLKRLQRVLGPAMVALLLQTLFMIYLAQMLAPFLSWNSTSTLFFGSLLAISSSMVTVRVLRDSGRMQDAGSQFTIGILILEDVLAVILLVILTGVAVTQSFDWDAAWLVIFLMGIFVVMVFVIGRAFVPRALLAVCGEKANPEVMTLVSTGLVMGVSLLALRMDFSPALGAFVAGTLLSQTQVAQKVEHVNRSLHDVFSAVFFVAIGMQMDPAMLIQNLLWILAISLLVVGGKIVSCWGGLCLAGQSGRTAFMAAVPKSQIGEFSFIIAGLGSSLGVLDAKLTGIAFGVALTTIFLSPLTLRGSERLFDMLLKWTPKGFIWIFEAYQNLLAGLLVGLGRNVVLFLIRRPVIQIFIYFIIINGIFIAASFILPAFAQTIAAIPLNGLLHVAYWGLTGLLVSPFLIAILRNLNAVSYILTDALFGSMKDHRSQRIQLRKWLNIAILSLFLILLGVTFLMVAAPYLPDTTLAGFAFIIVTGVVILLRSRLIRVNSQMEYLFIESFRAEMESKEEQRRRQILDLIKNQAPWPIEVADLTLPAHAAWSGKLISELQLRSRFGVNILALGRGYSVLYDPGPGAALFSGDRLVLSGTHDAIEKVRASMEVQVNPEERPLPTPNQFGMEQVYVGSKSELAGETLAGSRIRQRFGVTVLGAQRNEKRIANPAPDFLILAGDVLLVAGLPEKINNFSSICDGKPLPLTN